MTHTLMCFNPVLGFLSVSTGRQRVAHALGDGFNPVLGFLSVSTDFIPSCNQWAACFNPVLGFLSVSTFAENDLQNIKDLFQSRAGFSECLDPGVVARNATATAVSIPCWVF